MVSLRVLAFVILTVKGLHCESTIDCTENSYRLRCQILNLNELSEGYELHWFQKFKKTDSLIGPTSVVKGKQLKFEMWIQKFDNETYITAEIINSKHRRVHFPNYTYQVSTNKNYYDTKDTNKYSESIKVNFACRNDAHSRVGWIQTNGESIIIFDNANHSQAFYKWQNGSMLCCLRYELNNYTLTRYIEDITMLIYEEPSNQDYTTTSTTIDHSTSLSTTSTTLETTTMTSLRPSSEESTRNPNNHQPASTQKPKATDNPLNTKEPKPSENIEETQNTDHHNVAPSTSAKTKYDVIIASVAASILVALLTYVIVKKCTRKVSDPKVTLQLEETHASTNVVYAELDLKPGNAPVSATKEDNPYAEIIGVLRPNPLNSAND